MRILQEEAAKRHARVVLVTGAAGFIGFHTTLQLNRERDAVIGLDNFNHDCDVQLKHECHGLLKRAGIHTLIQGDVCDADISGVGRRRKA